MMVQRVPYRLQDSSCFVLLSEAEVLRLRVLIKSKPKQSTAKPASPVALSVHSGLG